MPVSDMEMRDAFFNALYAAARKDRRIMLLSDDFGAPSLDKFRADLPDQYINIGIAEQNMISVAAGLSLEGKIVFSYAIAPFITLRCYEQIKIDLCTMNLPVTLLGVGAGYGYDTAGPTHHAIEDISIMRVLPNMTILCPSTAGMAAECVELACSIPEPKYIRLERGKFPSLYSGKIPLANGFAELKKGSDVSLVATGMMTHVAIEVATVLHQHAINAGVIDLYRIKPISDIFYENIIDKAKRLVTLEEHLITGGIGSLVAEIIADNNSRTPLKRFGIREDICFQYAKRKYLHALCNIDADSISDTIINWIKDED